MMLLKMSFLESTNSNLGNCNFGKKYHSENRKFGKNVILQSTMAEV